MASLALSIKNLTKDYDNGFKALRGLSLKVETGDFFALLGPNGAGKSTTIGIISSLVRKTSGLVEIYGTDIDQDFSTAKKYLGVVPQEFNFNQFETPLDILLYQAGFYGISRHLALPKAKELLSLMSLWEKRHQQARLLSGGMKRRLMIARAMMHDPKLLILDEPTAGVDIELRRSMWSIMRDLNAAGTTIILTTHYLEEAEQLCKNIAIIDHGTIVTCTSMKNLLGRLGSQSYLFDLSLSLNEVPHIPEIVARLVDSQTLEVEIQKGKSLCDVFDWFRNEGIDVLSMRNKSNRLEELFLKLTKSSPLNEEDAGSI